MARIPAPNADLTRRRTLLHLAVDVCGSQQAAADVLGVARSTVTQWLSGDREVEWHMVHVALQRAIRRHPEEAPRVVGVLASELLDQQGVWLPRLDPDDVGDVSEEGADVVSALGEVLQAAKAGDAAAVARSAPRLIREAAELDAAARRSA
jgi:hypothetical protein